MYHNVLISKDHPQHAELEKAIALILAFSNANTIYFSPHLEEDLNAGIIMVIIGADSPHSWDELNENYWKVFETFPQFSFRVFDANWVKDELKDGNPFFAMHCNKNTLVYSTIESIEVNFTEKLKHKRFLKKVKCQNKSKDYAAFILALNVKFYVRGENYLQAAYILHQTIRWMLIEASIFLTGEYIVEHDLVIQQKHIRKYSKHLAQLFDSENEEEIKLMALLNGACYSVQNGHEQPEITMELIEGAVAKKEWMRTEVSRLFAACICRCQYEFSRSKSPLIAIDEGNPLKVITRIITNSVSASAVYCFGQRTINKSAVSTILDDPAVNFESNHYYMFVIAKSFQSDVLGNIAYSVKEQTGGRCTVTVVMHSKKSLHQKAGDQQHFFYQIMQRGTLLFQEISTPPYLPFDEVPTRNIKSAKMYLQQRDRTKTFLMEAEAMDSGGATKIQVYLMHLVIEQTCLGLIRLFLGYLPNHHNLSFLFELCEYFTPLTAELFPRETQKDKELLKILSGYTTSLRYGFIDDVVYHDYMVLSNRYNEFVKRADKLAATELEKLEKLNENTNQNT
ncbi:MAG: hypothetical protein H7239_10110 [Flavobacterium sp.]|nr:hypothetical protein [Flavobacterium sp.]